MSVCSEKLLIIHCCVIGVLPRFNFVGLKNLQEDGLGVRIFRNLTSNPFVCSHLLDVSSLIVPSASRRTTPKGNKDVVHISL